MHILCRPSESTLDMTGLISGQIRQETNGFYMFLLVQNYKGAPILLSVSGKWSRNILTIKVAGPSLRQHGFPWTMLFILGDDTKFPKGLSSPKVGNKKTLTTTTNRCV